VGPEIRTQAGGSLRRVNGEDPSARQRQAGKDARNP